MKQCDLWVRLFAAVAREDLAEAVFHLVGEAHLGLLARSVDEDRKDVDLAARGLDISREARDAADMARLRVDPAAQVGTQQAMLQRAPLVAVDRERIQEHLRRGLAAHVGQQLDQIRGAAAVLAAQAGAVDLVEVLHPGVLLEEFPDGLDGGLGGAPALHLPAERPEDHLRIEVLAALVAGRQRRRQIALEEGELLIAPGLLQELGGFLETARDLDPARGQRLLEDRAEVHRRIVDGDPGRRAGADVAAKGDGVRPGRAGEAERVAAGAGRAAGLVQHRDTGRVRAEGDFGGLALAGRSNLEIDTVVVERESAEGGGPPGPEVVALPARVEMDVVKNPRMEDEAVRADDAGRADFRGPVAEDRGRIVLVEAPADVGVAAGEDVEVAAQDADRGAELEVGAEPAEGGGRGQQLRVRREKEVGALAAAVDGAAGVEIDDADADGGVPELEARHGGVEPLAKRRGFFLGGGGEREQEEQGRDAGSHRDLYRPSGWKSPVSS